MKQCMTVFGNYPHHWIVCILQCKDEPDIADTPVAPLTVTDDAPAAVHFNPEGVSVVVKEEIVTIQINLHIHLFSESNVLMIANH